jgi:hypothetical protein
MAWWRVVCGFLGVVVGYVFIRRPRVQCPRCKGHGHFDGQYKVGDGPWHPNEIGCGFCNGKGSFGLMHFIWKHYIDWVTEL